MAAPLEGIRVLELGRVLAAPFCGQMLGDLGADVIKIEMAGVGDESRAYGPPFVDGQSFYFLSLNRNKESVTLNLKDERGKDLLRKLIARADVFVHNSVPGPMERLGFSYDAVRKINPRIIYCGISGYGQSGPDRDKPSLDMMAQALSGIMFLTGEPDGAPMRSGAATSLLESSVSLLTYQASRYFVTGENPTRLGNAHPSIVPYDCYRTADGWVTVAIMNQPMWERFCKALDLEDLTCDPRFHTNPERVQNRDALREILYERMGSLPTADVIARFNSANVPCAEVRDLHAVFADPQAQHVGLRQTISHAATGDIDVVAPAFHLSASPTTLRKPPPRLGEHNEKILGELGLRSQEIEALRSDGVI
jgi:crotonobetainyl-CoA:carnitine CoA-transferase CaiB-like acyl-CoA transferase